MFISRLVFPLALDLLLETQKAKCELAYCAGVVLALEIISTEIETPGP